MNTERAARLLQGEGNFYGTLNPSVTLRVTGPGCGHPASTSCCKQHLCLAGRGPNSNALYPPLAAVVAVAPNRGAFGKTGNLPGLPRPPLLGEVAKPIGFDGEV